MRAERGRRARSGRSCWTTCGTSSCCWTTWNSGRDVDGARIGITGVSLGGMHSWLAAAADARIAVAAPMIGVQARLNLLVSIIIQISAVVLAHFPVLQGSICLNGTHPWQPVL